VRVAIVKLSALGDIVHAMIVLPFIRRALPDVRIDWVVEEGFAGVLEHHPDIDRILPVRLKALKKTPSRLFAELEQVKAYARNDYDLVIDLQGLIKSALLARMLGETAGFDRHSIREKAAALFYHRRFSIPYETNVIERNMALVTAALGLHVTADDLREKEPLLHFDAQERARGADLLSGSRRNIVYILGSSWESKVYPVERMTEVVEVLGEHALLVWGNEKEHQLAESIAKRTEATIVPRLTLGELKALIAQADLTIGGDSGPTHFAWALNRPSITLFGPTPAARNMLETAINRSISSASPVDPLHLNRNDFSIAEIEPEAIVALARKLLEGQVGSAKDAA
jgi:heptosyltransferase-1